ncbi:ATP-binding protein [Chryseolinea sp. T2]|uniref:sensor histidine kinase n=1 Tax=Chryseolinea sp. T2 TaxID=3129255 RepID=UPI003076F104
MQVGFFMLFRLGSYVSLLTMHSESVSDYYLPTCIALVLTYWTSPKHVLPAMYLNAVTTSYLWGTPAEQWKLWFLFGVPETIFPLLSWLLFRYFQGKYWVPDIRNLVLFMGVGIFIPVVIEVMILQSFMVITGAQKASTFWPYSGSNILGEFTTNFLITIPALHYLTPLLQKRGWTHDEFVIHDTIPIQRHQIVEIAFVFLVMLVMSFFLQFSRFWYLYGLFSLYVAIRFGFGAAILTNFYVIVIAYVMPILTSVSEQSPLLTRGETFDVFVGANFLFAFAVVTGRVMSDMRSVERKLIIQNELLEKTNADMANANARLEVANRELDRFAYSVSHDLSAPLKTIQGIVNISRFNSGNQQQYFEKIGTSAQKLLTFIAEVLDYSRNKRQDIELERIDLKAMCTGIIENIAQLHGERMPDIIFDLHVNVIQQDKNRIRVILSNIISNAVLFQRQSPEETPVVKIASYLDGNQMIIEIEDNGEGIRSEVKPRVFEMFYRGNERSQGSGLGLYITQDVVTRMGGSICFQSTYGQGSTFTITLPVSNSASEQSMQPLQQ